MVGVGDLTRVLIPLSHSSGHYLSIAARYGSKIEHRTFQPMFTADARFAGSVGALRRLYVSCLTHLLQAAWNVFCSSEIEFLFVYVAQYRPFLSPQLAFDYIPTIHQRCTSQLDWIWISATGNMSCSWQWCDWLGVSHHFQARIRIFGLVEWCQFSIYRKKKIASKK